MKSPLLDIGEFAARAGVAASTLRFYESRGLLTSIRETPQSRRKYPRFALRQVAFIKAAQNLGLSLTEIESALGSLPEKRIPTRKDWELLSAPWAQIVDDRIAELLRLRDALTRCIGCGCLSIDRCALFNSDDAAARLGAGARYLLAKK
jgi:MerR family redox-sensitive transcriptional activator SoxR